MRLAVSLLHGEDEARDVVQEVFLKLWESNIRVENPMAFLLRAVRNACLNRINMLDTRDKICRRLMVATMRCGWPYRNCLPLASRML